MEIPRSFISLAFPNRILRPSIGISEQNIAAVDPASHPKAGDRGKAFRIGKGELPRFGALDDRLAEGVLGTPFQRGG